ncbi:MAG: NAD(P)H-dependent amine dehydrogenase family protein [Solimonas sp.]
MSEETLRVIHCGTGVAGHEALGAILRNPALHLVDLQVHSERNAGRDAMALAGLAGPVCGIRSTTSLDALLALDADVVCYMMLVPDLDAICALLASGKNVVTTAGLMWPQATDAQAMRRLQDACRKGQASFYATGINPGWADEILPLTMSALCRDIRRVHIREYADCSRYPAPHILSVMGFGRPLADVHEGRLPDMAIMRDFFRQTIAALAHGLALRLDDITESREFAIAPRDYEIAAGPIGKGTIAAQRWRWQGLVGGEPRIVQDTYWITAFDLGEGWPRSGEIDNDTQWQVTIEGTPSLRCTFEPRHSFADRARAAADYNPSGLATAMAAVNSLWAVHAAAPGVLTSADLPLPRCRQPHALHLTSAAP